MKTFLVGTRHPVRAARVPTDCDFLSHPIAPFQTPYRVHRVLRIHRVHNRHSTGGQLYLVVWVLMLLDKIVVVVWLCGSNPWLSMELLIIAIWDSPLLLLKLYYQCSNYFVFLDDLFTPPNIRSTQSWQNDMKSSEHQSNKASSRTDISFTMARGGKDFV